MNAILEIINPVAEPSPSPDAAIELGESNICPGPSPSPPPREERAGERRPFVRGSLDSMAVPSPEPCSAHSEYTDPSGTPHSEPCTPHSEHRGRGKIACLPKKVRAHLNQMIEDGVRYAQIKENLGEHGKNLTPNNFSEWKKRGHQHWLKQQFWREEMHARMDAFTDLLGDTDPAQLPMAGLQMSLIQLCEQLRDVGPGSRKDQFEADADKYLRMLNTLSRLSKSVLALQKFQRHSAAAAVELKRLDPDRKLSDRERHAIVRQVDEILGIPSMDDSSAAEPAQPEGLADISRGSQSAQTPGNVPAESTLPERMPEISRDPSLQSKNKKQNSKITETPASSAGVLACGSGGHPCPAVPPVEAPQSEFKIQNSKMAEHCLECRTPLPALLANGDRPQERCENCGEMLRRPGIYYKPSLDRCPACSAALPHPLPTGERYSEFCLKCEVRLPPYEPPAPHPNSEPASLPDS